MGKFWKDSPSPLRKLRESAGPAHPSESGGTPTRRKETPEMRRQFSDARRRFWRKATRRERRPPPLPGPSTEDSGKMPAETSRRKTGKSLTGSLKLGQAEAIRTELGGTPEEGGNSTLEDPPIFPNSTLRGVSEAPGGERPTPKTQEALTRRIPPRATGAKVFDRGKDDGSADSRGEEGPRRIFEAGDGGGSGSCCWGTSDGHKRRHVRGLREEESRPHKPVPNLGHLPWGNQGRRKKENGPDSSWDSHNTHSPIVLQSINSRGTAWAHAFEKEHGTQEVEPRTLTGIYELRGSLRGRMGRTAPGEFGGKRKFPP